MTLVLLLDSLILRQYVARMHYLMCIFQNNFGGMPSDPLDLDEAAINVITLSHCEVPGVFL